jgi:hypothetical protein
VADFDRGGKLGGLLGEVGFAEVRALGRAWLFGRISLWEARKT